ncbi:MAG: peptidyl-alpha-hydroxyglycine alpha-amidating lyase family protein [Thermodesulfobacteriota bacterium]
MSIRMGSGRFTYEAQAGWAKLPKGWSFLEVVDVAVDAQDRVYVFTRGEHPLLIFDREGNLLASWGEGLFKRPHGITMGPKETLYLIDDGGHAVYQFTLGGKLLMTLGTPGKGAGFMSGQPFNQPTKVARDPKTGELYISDGYGNARVHKYTSDGKYLFSWGECGTDPGQFNLVHSVVLDRAGRVFVADRENHRIQIFDSQGKFLAIWNNVHRPCGLHIAGEGEELVYVGELAPPFPFSQNYPNVGGRISIYDLKGNRLARLGDIRAGEEPHQFLAPHGLAVNSRGDIYIGEVSWTFRGKTLSPPRELPSFRKLVKVG